MKQIYVDNQATDYYIFEDGRLLNKKTGNYYKGTVRGGYRQFDLKINGRKQTFSQHRLLAEYYLSNPNHYPIVHHKDGNKLNNDLSNLEWVSYSENNLSDNRHESTIVYIPIEYDEEKENWVSYKDTRYLVSSYGRVKNGETNKCLKGKISTVGYREYCLRIDGKKKTFLAHRLVWEAFKHEVPEVINHIDGNKLNNNLENLENVSYRDNNIKAIYETKSHNYKPVGQFDKEGNLIQTFTTNAEAARAMHVQPASIWAAIKKGYCSCGYYWKHIDFNE